MRITCPWCGPRPLSEFTYGGDASKIRPLRPEKANQQVWSDYVYLRNNPAGRHKEYWHHSGGCRSWLVVTRDTTNHKISNTTMAKPLPRGVKL